MEETVILTHPPAVWVQIDLNARSRDGYVRARVSRANGPVVVGDENVIAYEPDDRVAAPARVMRVDAERGFVYLDVAWADMDDDVAYGSIPALSFAHVPGSESNAAADVCMRLNFVERLKALSLLRPHLGSGLEITSPSAQHMVVA